uniref:DUF148 domain-containing protein n=1 Tax=Angiostrongylus cantonensis TaxID=6313 RepID=A0A0K0CSU2_ANGCA
MKCVFFFAIVGIATCIVQITPKKILVGKVNDLVTGFLNESQISTCVDIIALDIHKTKQPEEIMSDLYDYLKTTLTTAQLKNISDGYKAMIKDLGDEGANDVLRRTKMVVAYGVSPAIDMVEFLEVHANGETPDMAYMAMSKQLTPDFVKSVVVLIKDTLTPAEWNSVKTHFGAMIRIM